MSTLVGGEEVSKYKDGDEQFSVRMRLDEQFRNDPRDDGRHLRARGGRPHGARQRRRAPHARQRAGIDRPLQPDAPDLGQREPRSPEDHARRRDRRRRAARSASSGLKAGYQVTFGGSARTLSQAGNDFVLAIVLSVLFIYMVLASQFNSFIHPLTIMTSLPLSLPAGLLALMAFGMTINVYSAIGLMMLFGIVKKNSILQVDYTNTLREEGMDRHQALDPGQPRAPAADPDDDDRDRRRHAADRVRPRRRLGLARVDGGHDHRRPDPLPAAHAADHAGRLLVLRRPARVAAERPADAAARSCGARACPRRSL